MEIVRGICAALKGPGLVGAATIPARLGALRAFEEAGRAPIACGQSRCRTGGSKGIAGASNEAH